jgi:antitoxin (DNA-binding transcriptional repressor) of toxin-antitoxin stability system
MTATQALRNFGAMLDAVEQGETIVVTRDGITIGKFVPEHSSVAERLTEVFEKYPGRSGVWRPS